MQFQFGQRRQVAQRLEFPLPELARAVVDQAQGSDRAAIGRPDPVAGIETHPRCACHERVFGEAVVEQRIGNHQRLRQQDGVGTERLFARCLLRVQAGVRLEPLALCIDERNQCDRNIEQLRRQPRDAVEAFLRRCVEQVQRLQRAQPFVLVGRHGRAFPTRAGAQQRGTQLGAQVLRRYRQRKPLGRAGGFRVPGRFACSGQHDHGQLRRVVDRMQCVAQRGAVAGAQGLVDHGQRQRFGMCGVERALHVAGFARNHALGRHCAAQPVREFGAGARDQHRPRRRRAGVDLGFCIAGRCLRHCGTGLQFDHAAFGGGEHLERAGGITHALPGRRDHRVDGSVVMRRVMVEQRQAPDPRRHRQVDHVLQRAVPPAHVARVLGRRVLAVVDQQVGAGDKFTVALVPRMHVSQHLAERLAEAPRRARMALMVGRVDQHHPVGLDPVTERQRRVVQVTGCHPRLVNHETALDQVVVTQRRAHRIEVDREIGVLHLPGQRFPQRRAKAARRIHVPLVGPVEQRCEERETLDMVPVGMADEDVAAQRRRALRLQGVAQDADSRSGVEYQLCPVAGAHFHARGVAAVTHRLRPGCGNRTACTPESDAHRSAPLPISTQPLLHIVCQFLPAVQRAHARCSAVKVASCPATA